MALNLMVKFKSDCLRKSSTANTTHLKPGGYLASAIRASTNTGYWAVGNVTKDVLNAQVASLVDLTVRSVPMALLMQRSSAFLAQKANTKQTMKSAPNAVTKLHIVKRATISSLNVQLALLRISLTQRTSVFALPANSTPVQLV